MVEHLFPAMRPSQLTGWGRFKCTGKGYGLATCILYSYSYVRHFAKNRAPHYRLFLCVCWNYFKLVSPAPIEKNLDTRTDLRSSVFFFPLGNGGKIGGKFWMYPLGTTTFSHQKIRFPTISHQFAEVVGKKIIFSSGKPKKNWRWWETEKKIPTGKKKTLVGGPQYG